jgi:ABC-type nitrate/sulfonate/bicarbonate transport system substrate-binding protein
MWIKHQVLKTGAVAAAALTLAACGGQAAPSAAPSSAAPASVVASVKPADSASASGAAAASAKPAASAGASAAAKPAATAEPGTTLVHIATVGSISDAGFYLAADRGYLKEQGLSADFQVLTTGPQMVPLLATGQLDVAGGSVSGALFSAIQRDIPLKIVADKGHNDPHGFTFAYLLARKDLYDSGQIKGWADFKGRKVAISATDNSGQYQLYKALKSVGLTLNDVDIQLLGYPDQGAAFANKAIDASQNIEPFATNYSAKDLTVIMPDQNQVYDGVQAAVVMYGPKFVQDKPDIGKKLMVAYLKGVRDYNRAFTKGTDKDAVIQSLLTHTSVKDRSLYDKMGLPGLNPDGLPNEADISAQQDFFYSMGYEKNKLDLKPVLDHEFVDYAISQLGKYSG